ANVNGNSPFGTTTKGNYLKRPTPVGSYASNYPHPWGLCDMHGNVWEWCANTYDQMKVRVVRGGSWNFVGEYCRAAARCWNEPHNRHDNDGCRVLLSVG